MLHKEGRTSERVVNARGGSGMKRPDEARMWEPTVAYALAEMRGGVW